MKFVGAKSIQEFAKAVEASAKSNMTALRWKTEPVDAFLVSFANGDQLRVTVAQGEADGRPAELAIELI